MENALCPLCRDEVENVQHLLCTCKVTHRVWDLCERWIGSVTTRHESIPFNFLSFHLMGLMNCVNRVWKGMWVVIATEIWNHRNKVVFRGGVVDEVKVFYLAQLKGWL